MLNAPSLWYLDLHVVVSTNYHTSLTHDNLCNILPSVEPTYIRLCTCIVFYAILINLHGIRMKAHGVQMVALESFVDLGFCMVKVHMNF